MGIGDEIMASGHALAAHRKTGKRVRIVGLNNAPRWSDVWAGLPWIAAPGEAGDFATIINGPQCRPYIRYPFTRQLGCTYADWSVQDQPGALALTDAERRAAEALTSGTAAPVILEPHLHARSNPNKQWGWSRWAKLAAILIARGYSIAQIGPRGTRVLPGVTLLETPTFRIGAAVMQRARGLILPECGLHHAAGVLGLRAVVLFGGATDPRVTGYAHHYNLRRPPACGRWLPCTHCLDIWNSISALEVARIFERYCHDFSKTHAPSGGTD